MLSDLLGKLFSETILSLLRGIGSEVDSEITD